MCSEIRPPTVWTSTGAEYGLFKAEAVTPCLMIFLPTRLHHRLQRHLQRLVKRQCFTLTLNLVKVVHGYPRSNATKWLTTMQRESEERTFTLSNGMKRRSQGFLATMAISGRKHS